MVIQKGHGRFILFFFCCPGPPVLRLVYFGMVHSLLQWSSIYRCELCVIFGELCVVLGCLVN